MSIAVIFLLLLSFFYCNNENNNYVQENEYQIDSLNQKRENIKMVFYTLPTPMEMAKIFKGTGIEYDKAILNPVTKLSRYNTNKDMAVNLGIYGADLSFASMFEKEQDIMDYFKVVKQLATKMDIIGAVSDSLMQVIEDNIANNEKLRKLVAETFFSSDAFLKENSREEIAAIVAAGAWIESLYISIELSNKQDNKNNTLLDRIIDQRLALENLTKLLETYKQNADVVEILKDIYDIKNIFNELIIIEKIEVYDENAGINRIKTNVTHNATPEKIKLLKDKIYNVRNTYTN